MTQHHPLGIFQECGLSVIILASGLMRRSMSAAGSSAGLYITAKNIKYDGIKKDSATYVNSNVHTEIYSRCNPEYGDILYIKDGATAGVVAINDLKVPFSLLSSVALIKPLGILNRYLYYFLRSDFSNSSIKKSMKGVGITRITLRQIEEWNIPVPPYAEQERIVKILDNYFAVYISCRIFLNTIIFNILCSDV